ncbi:MAG: sulfite exporter TauE/SafE family protein [Crocinitomicaceae bacterium]|nr:sulfite exporter TauE/SafE family protein [Crocinitomicaceae bacterium]
MDTDLLFLIILPIVAFMYAAVGHGGASGYLALMSLFAFPHEVMKPTGLLLNLFVAAIAFYHFWRTGHFNWKLFVAFALGSIPLAYYGGTLEIDARIYKIILGVLLLFAIAKMLNLFGKESNDIRKIKWGEGIAVGGVIGFFSGLIGIGGGIILSPVILLMRWGKVKEAAAVSALFIWVNSASGMGGLMYAGKATLDVNSWLYVGLAVIGGFIGGYIGSKKMNNKGLRYLLAFVLILASVKLFLVK